MWLFQFFGVAWIGVTVALVALMIHRAILGFREEDQLFLAAGEAGLARRQVEVSERMFRLSRFVHILAWASGLMLTAMLSVAAFFVFTHRV